MIVVAMGAIDVLAAISLLITHFGLGLEKFLTYAAFYLIIKGLIFRRDVASIIDIGAGTYMILVAFLGLHTFFALIIAAYLVQKFMFSLI